ncbi:LEA type 2 family protein [Azotobacter beijerinckii]|uniref:LEA type 2 family protein n=1 Tax=Azotobacter beijerinckii TaxID=170623 RepID=UPI002954BD9F|nr:LEA type 2 family protein [Azotobacter beijerinckii]MDV7211047.1 LEA type 2 family protein [Azotobacter beijerinckii]
MFFQARITRVLGLLGLLGLLCGLAGCSTWLTGAFKDPDVQLVKIDVVKVRLLEQQFVLRFRVDNPNWTSLPIRGLDYEVFLNDIRLAKGASNKWFTVPARGREEFDVLVTTNLWRHMKSIVKLLKKPDQPIHYQLQGTAKTGLLFGRGVLVSRYGEITPSNYLQD